MKRNYRNQFLKLMIFLLVGALTLTASTPLAINISTKRIQEDSVFVSTCAGENELIITFKPSEITKTQITTDHGVFSLFMPSSGFIGALGKPQIPIQTQLYAVPSDQVTLEVLDAHIADSLHVGRVYPAQQPQMDDDLLRENEFFFDESFYQQDIEYPGHIVEIKNSGKIRDIPFVEIEFYPVQYNPKQEIATIYDEITIKLTIADNEQLLVESKFVQTPFYKFYANVFTNWEEFLENIIVEQNSFSNTGSRESGCDYLIITHPDFYSEITEFANWKHNKGLITKIVDTTETGSTATEIRQYIQDAYDTWDPAPSYILLVGDAEYVPTNYLYVHPYHGTYTASDMWYTTVSGSDYYPDIFIGRLPVDTTDQADTIVQKILTYEQTPPALPNYYENFVVAAYFQDDEQNGYETRRFVRTSEEVRDYLLSEEYNGERIYCTESYINPTHYNNGPYGNGEPLPEELLRPTFAWDGDAADIINAIESGIFILNHRDHGMESGWGDPYFVTSHIAGLTNGDLLPVVFSINCLTGRFDDTESFCEEFVRKTDGGAVAAFGASRVSYSGYNDYLCRGFYDAMWPDFDVNVSGDTPLYSLGEILNYGRIYLANTWGDPWGYERLTFEMFHVFGDPSMEIWTALPEELDVTCTATAEFVQVQVNCDGNPVEGALVCLKNEEGFYAKGLTDENGEIELDASTVSTEEVTLTVTAHNCLYYQTEVTLITNYAPEAPTIGGSHWAIGGIEYEYTFMSTDPNEHDVTYSVTWGYTGGHSYGPYPSRETITITHTWTKIGKFTIRAMAKDTMGAESNFSEFEVIIPFKGFSSQNSQLLNNLMQSIFSRTTNL